MGLTLCHPLAGQRAVTLQELEGARLLSLTGLADPWPRALLQAPPAAGPGETHLSSNRSPSTRKAQSCPSCSWISRPDFPPEWPWPVPLEPPPPSREVASSIFSCLWREGGVARGARWPEACLLIFSHPPHPAKSPVWTGEREQQPLLESVPGRRSLASQLHSARLDGSVPRKFSFFPSRRSRDGRARFWAGEKGRRDEGPSEEVRAKAGGGGAKALHSSQADLGRVRSRCQLLRLLIRCSRGSFLWLRASPGQPTGQGPRREPLPRLGGRS